MGMGKYNLLGLPREKKERGVGTSSITSKEAGRTENVRDTSTDLALFEHGGEGHEPSSVGSLWELRSSLAWHPAMIQSLWAFSGKYCIRQATKTTLEIEFLFGIQKETLS